jgi:hypothetical protein
MCVHLRRSTLATECAWREFYSINEAQKPPDARVHHNNSACGPGEEIPQDERCPGTNGYRLCKVCEQLNPEGK